MSELIFTECHCGLISLSGPVNSEETLKLAYKEEIA